MPTVPKELVAACEILRELNWVAKHPECSCSTEIYTAKAELIRRLINDKHLVSAELHTRTREYKPCFACDGSGYDWRDECERCDGSGAWDPGGTEEFAMCTFDLNGEKYVWHVPMDEVPMLGNLAKANKRPLEFREHTEPRRPVLEAESTLAALRAFIDKHPTGPAEVLRVQEGWIEEQVMSVLSFVNRLEQLADKESRAEKTRITRKKNQPQRIRQRKMALVNLTKYWRQMDRLTHPTAKRPRPTKADIARRAGAIYLTTVTLRHGWKREMVDRYLVVHKSVPNPHYKSGSESKLYLVGDIEDAERSAQWRAEVLLAGLSSAKVRACADKKWLKQIPLVLP